MIHISAPVVNITIHCPPQDLGPILEKLKAMASAQDQAAEELEAVGVKLDKISSETTSLVTDVRILKEELANIGTMTPRLRDALDRVSSKADAIDVQVDDIAPNPTDTPPDGTAPGG